VINIKTNLQETGCENVKWAKMAQSMIHWQDLVTMAMNHRVP